MFMAEILTDNLDQDREEILRKYFGLTQDSLVTPESVQTSKQDLYDAQLAKGLLQAAETAGATFARRAPLESPDVGVKEKLQEYLQNKNLMQQDESRRRQLADALMSKKAEKDLGLYAARAGGSSVQPGYDVIGVDKNGNKVPLIFNKNAAPGTTPYLGPDGTPWTGDIISKTVFTEAGKADRFGRTADRLESGQERKFDEGETGQGLVPKEALEQFPEMDNHHFKIVNNNVKAYQEETKKAREGLQAAAVAKAALENPNVDPWPIIASTLPRLAGEVGVMTDKDSERWVGDRAWVGKVNRLLSQHINITEGSDGTWKIDPATMPQRDRDVLMGQLKNMLAGRDLGAEAIRGYWQEETKAALPKSVQPYVYQRFAPIGYGPVSTSLKMPSPAPITAPSVPEAPKPSGVIKQAKATPGATAGKTFTNNGISYKILSVENGKMTYQEVK